MGAKLSVLKGMLTIKYPFTIFFCAFRKCHLGTAKYASTLKKFDIETST